MSTSGPLRTPSPMRFAESVSAFHPCPSPTILPYPNFPSSCAKAFHHNDSYATFHSRMVTASVPQDGIGTACAFALFYASGFPPGLMLSCEMHVGEALYHRGAVWEGRLCNRELPLIYSCSFFCLSRFILQDQQDDFTVTSPAKTNIFNK